MGSKGLKLQKKRNWLGLNKKSKRDVKVVMFLTLLILKKCADVAIRAKLSDSEF